VIQPGESIHFSQPYSGNIKIYNQVGKQVLEDYLHHQETFTIPSESMAGRYYITLTSKEHVLTVPLILN